MCRQTVSAVPLTSWPVNLITEKQYEVYGDTLCRRFMSCGLNRMVPWPFASK